MFLLTMRDAKGFSATIKATNIFIFEMDTMLELVYSILSLALKKVGLASEPFREALLASGFISI